MKRRVVYVLMDIAKKCYTIVASLSAAGMFAGKIIVARRVGIPLHHHIVGSAVEALGCGLGWPVMLVGGAAVRAFSFHRLMIWDAGHIVVYSNRFLFLPHGLEFLKIAREKSARGTAAAELLVKWRIIIGR